MVILFPNHFDSGLSLQDPNFVRMRREGLNREHVVRYKSKTRDSLIYRIAARLWAAGTEFQRALDIARESFDNA